MLTMPTNGGSVPMGSSSTYGKYTALKNPITINMATGQRGTLNPTGAAAPKPAAPAANPYTSAAMNRLQSIAEGKEVPLDEATKANMLSKSQEGAAAAEAAQNQSLMDGAMAGGASPNDPSLQAAKRQNMAQRQGSNQQAARDIELETRKQNFAASQGAAESLAGFGQAQQRIDQNDPNNPANAQIISNPAPGLGGMGPSPLGFQFGGGGGGSSAVNQAAKNRLAQPAPQQSAADKQAAALAAKNRSSGLASVRQRQNDLDTGKPGPDPMAQLYPGFKRF